MFCVHMCHHHCQQISRLYDHMVNVSTCKRTRQAPAFMHHNVNKSVQVVQVEPNQINKHKRYMATPRWLSLKEPNIRNVSKPLIYCSHCTWVFTSSLLWPGLGVMTFTTCNLFAWTERCYSAGYGCGMPFHVQGQGQRVNTLRLA